MTYLLRIFAAALAAFFIAPSLAQNSGTVPLYSVPLGLGAGKQGFGSVALGNGQILIGQTSAAPTANTPSGDVTITPSGVTAIGANKVTNSQLATMNANTTKCNATAGTANPTDCNASTMRTNMGVVIGTNVEAWDTDLDCLAALSSTGVISRTGSGTCSAGALALSGLATGTQDTVIGYWGSTTATAIAINNCTGALTYSTSTHTFGCNSSAGTGTVTSVTCGDGLTGGTFTTTGTCATDPAFGGWKLLNTLTASTSGSLPDTSNITSTYKDYQLVLSNIVPVTNGVDCLIQVQTSGSFQTTSYLSVVTRSSSSATATVSITNGIPCSGSGGQISNSSIGVSGTLTIIGPVNSASMKIASGQFTYLNAGSVAEIAVSGGFFNSAVAMTGVRLILSSGNIASGTMKIYGRN